MSNFRKVAEMNVAFGNQPNLGVIDWERMRRQCRSIGHEFGELLVALGADPAHVKALMAGVDAVELSPHAPVDLEQVRDSLCDIHVFAYGAHYFMNVDADADMTSVLGGVMTRFIKNDEDKAATIAKHAAKGVMDVYFEGEYPYMIMKSASDQPDAPKGKFLKSASYQEPVFYERHSAAPEASFEPEQRLEPPAQHAEGSQNVGA